MTMFMVFAIVAGIAFVIETLRPLHPKQPRLRAEMANDGVFLVLAIGTRLLVNGSLLVIVGRLLRQQWPDFRGLLSPLPLWLEALTLIVVLDGVYYLLHRLKHATWLFRLHETHHSSRVLDWFASVRFHPLEKLFDRTIYLLPLVLLAPSEPALLILACVDAVVATLSHANVRLEYGPLQYLVVSPKMHRYHHSPEGERYNFANNLAVFDWVFGTAKIPTDTSHEVGLGDPTYPTSLWAQLKRPFIAK